ncbi:EAL domain-containing protein [Billgrantia gudaonensis]|uniref:EAL domain-containing protein n=1 Tax=Billgrantia gudaonensis TaxID=376427 RepID=A0A3S0NDN4_9GAMM|nr:EAL domain-containing protein [Halomonas gudaonensis]
MPSKLSPSRKPLVQCRLRSSIDDFGNTGYPLLLPARFAADALKIDIIRARDARQPPCLEPSWKTIIAMAQALGMQTVAEGGRPGTSQRSAEMWLRSCPGLTLRPAAAGRWTSPRLWGHAMRRAARWTLSAAAVGTTPDGRASTTARDRCIGSAINGQEVIQLHGARI